MQLPDPCVAVRAQLARQVLSLFISIFKAVLAGGGGGGAWVARLDRVCSRVSVQNGNALQGVCRKLCCQVAGKRWTGPACYCYCYCYRCWLRFPGDEPRAAVPAYEQRLHLHARIWYVSQTGQFQSSPIQSSPIQRFSGVLRFYITAKRYIAAVR